MKFTLNPRISHSGRNRPGKLPCSKKEGIALIFVLAMLVLMMGLVMAFFSRAQLARQTGSSRVSFQQASLLADTAAGIVVGDLLTEIAAGSEPDEFSVPAEGANVFRPLFVDTTVSLLGNNSVKLSAAPSMVPQRVVGGEENAPASLLKQSLHGRPFFSGGGGGIPDRASAENSATSNAQGGAIRAERWGKPGFGTAEQTISPPDWIYLTRSGETPATFSSSWADASPSQGGYVIGRFAYNLYDIGGLIDINVVGNSLAQAEEDSQAYAEAEENSRRGRLNQVSLANAPGTSGLPDFGDFLEWRSGGSDFWSDLDALLDPGQNFLSIQEDAQGLLDRQDLLAHVEKYAETPNPPITPGALPLLTTFSREWNAPSYEPEPNRPLLPAPLNPGDSTPQQLNPALTSQRFPTETTLERGTDPAVVVPAGTPVLARRFPLTKIALLSNPAADPKDLLYYFGLERQSDGSFQYVAATPDKGIKRLDEIALEGREPNFFELLQAVIVTGSLGRNAGNSITIDEPLAELRSMHAVQIGTNIIDQWDEDSFPTEIAFPSGYPGDWLVTYGTENLPYVNNVEFLLYHPEWNRNLSQAWMLFDVWNPHQNPSPASEKNIAEFRIQPVSGRLRVNYGLQLDARDLGENWPYLDDIFQLGGYQGTLDQFVVDLNKNRQLTFPSSDSYEVPTPLPGTSEKPLSEDYVGGILLHEVTFDSEDSSVAYKAPPVPKNPDEMLPGSKVRDGYWNDTHTEFYPGVNQILESYGKELLPPDGEGFFGAKAFNYFRLFGRTGDSVILHAEYRPAGSDEWRTYQVIDSLIPNQNQLPPFGGPSAGSTTVTNLRPKLTAAEIERVRLWGADVVLPNGDDVKVIEFDKGDHSFYHWPFPNPEDIKATSGAFFGGYKMDPRSIRFGYSAKGTMSRCLGRTLRESTAPINWSSIRRSSSDMVANRKWLVASGHVPGWARDIKLPPFKPDPRPDFEWSSIIENTSLRAPLGLIRNIPEGSSDPTTNPARYRDRDGIIRPADGYLGTIPTAVPIPSSGLGSIDDRSVVLDRPFRSVAEMGYSFRDLPWKTLDFFTRNSGDLGLLDAFSLDESEDNPPLIAGKVNLNSAPREVLEVLLEGTAKTPSTSPTAPRISSTEAETIAGAIVNERLANGPFSSRGELVSRVLSPTSASDPGVIADIRKTEREAAIRTLGEIGSTRTWNFLLDLVVQTGRMKPNAAGPGNFMVRAEQRVWVSLAIDRFTGEVVDEKWETVDE